MIFGSIIISAKEETADNGETVTENAVDIQPATATESTPTVEATPEPNTRKQYPTRVRHPPERW